VLHLAFPHALIPFLGIALFTRIRPHHELENGTRKGIFEAVCIAPGLGVHAIASTAGVSYSTACYHLERLVAAGMLVMTPDGNKLRYYQNGGTFTESERRILPLLKNVEASRVLDEIVMKPGTYRAELAGRLGVTPTTINWHLRRLREAGLVEETRRGRNAFLYPRLDALRDALASLAGKVGVSEPAVADRLRRYTASGAGTAA
jgi:predicted transcriptional regulator